MQKQILQRVDMSMSQSNQLVPLDTAYHAKPAFIPDEADNIGIANMYGDGIVQIPMQDIVGNKTAVQMVLNERRTLVSQINALRSELTSVRESAATSLADVKAQAEHLKASPFVAMIGGTISVFGTAMVGLGFKWLTSQYPSNLGYVVVIIGICTSLTGNLANYLFPKWVGRGSRETNLR